MKKTLPLVVVATTVFGLGSLSSCQDYEPYDSEVLVKTSFEENFKKAFGEISPNQTWDLTKVIPRTWKYDVDLSGITTRATDAGEQYTAAPASEILSANQPRNVPTNEVGNNTNWLSYGWYEVQNTTLNWLNENIPESVVNTSKGSPFTLHAPSNAFAIIPIYQGFAGLVWDLHLVDMTNKKDYNLWSRSQGIWRRRGNNNWSQPDQTYANGSTIETSRNSGVKYNKIVGKPIIIDANKVHGEFFLYLDITSGGNDTYAHDHEAQCSHEGMMLALHCPLPGNLDQFTGVDESFCMVVGCEDANLSGSDWDMNDVVFLIVGYPNIPDVVEHYFKRYLCEDLGNTFDFDFNDIVVDVQQTSFINVEYDADGNPVRKEDMSKRIQTASIEHICGSLPFQVTVGNYTFPAVSDPTNQEQTEDELGEVGEGTLNSSGSTGAPTRATLPGYDPEVTEHITGWDRNANNISIAVAGHGQSSVLAEATAFGTKVEEENAEKHIYRIDFPDDGEVPLIIAVDRYVHWMDEFEHIPEEWWKEGKLYDPKQPADPLAWISEHPLKFDADGNPILEHHVEHLKANKVNEIEDFHNQTSGHAHLVLALNLGYNTLVLHFAEAVSGRFSLKTGEDTVLHEAVAFESTTELSIPLTDVDINTITYEDGLKIEIAVSQDVNIRNITAAITSGN